MSYEIVYKTRASNGLPNAETAETRAWRITARLFAKRTSRRADVPGCVEIWPLTPSRNISTCYKAGILARYKNGRLAQ
jgi:hypothetical protein